jgi:hypothetical protein
VALKSDGSVIAWGQNTLGQATVPVAARSGVVAIAAESLHSVALKSNGSVIVWGAQGDPRITTVPVAARSGVVAIAAGEVHTVALKSSGAVVAWGLNDYGQTTVPAGLPPAFAIAAGSLNTLALVREPAPSLTILRNADQTLSLSWTGAGALEETNNLAAPNWMPAPSQDNPQNINTTDPMKFFRLRYNP